MVAVGYTFGDAPTAMARPVQRTNDTGPQPGTRAKPRVDKEARKADYLRAAAKAFLTKGAKDGDAPASCS